MQTRAFLRWLLIVSAADAGFLIMLMTGLCGEIWVKDASYLSATTFVLFTVMSLVVGHATWHASRTPAINKFQHKNVISDIKDRLRHLSVREEIGWFGSELCLVLGMLGTIIGFVLMLRGFEVLNIKDAASIQSLLGELGKSMATALYTTLVGLICGGILKMQCLNLGLELRSKQALEE